VQFAGRPLETDVSAGDWVAAALEGQTWTTVASIVPPVFEACARIFHPAVRYADELLPPSATVAPLPPDEDVTWAEVAAFNGRTAHPAMEWASITGSWEYRGNEDQPGMWNDAPAEGHLPTSVAARLAAVLAGHTGTPADCWFGLWHGFGAFVADGPTLVVPHREYWLLRGPVELAAANMAEEPSEQSASLWWPADRAWYVATDLDLMSTYVGGTAACIADLLSAEGLEAAEVTPDQHVSWDADTVNPLPQDGPGQARFDAG
jgi:hypothetical protein